jgi:hypothetical protein
VRETAPAEARRAFPDNPDVTWIVHSAANDGGHVAAELEPQPATVGYPRFLLIFGCGPGDAPVRYGTYARQNDAWTLLSTTDGSPPLPPTHP